MERSNVTNPDTIAAPKNSLEQWQSDQVPIWPHILQLGTRKNAFSHQFSGEKISNPPNKAKVKIPIQWNSISEKFLQQVQWFQQNLHINYFVLGTQFSPVLKLLLLKFSGQILLSRFIQLQRYIYFNSLPPCPVEYMLNDSVYFI